MVLAQTQKFRLKNEMKESDVNQHSYGCPMLDKKAKNTDWKNKTKLSIFNKCCG